jgi:2-polyprenyl-6-methoxyphenol hydroxylase-like FAD-dependent oxidoreductase
MWAFIAKKEKYPLYGELAGRSGKELQEMVLGMIKDWGPNLKSLVRLSDPDTIAVLPIRSSVPVAQWETKNITLVGDAIHSMTPMRGIGANVALLDA